MADRELRPNRKPGVTAFGLPPVAFEVYQAPVWPDKMLAGWPSRLSKAALSRFFWTYLHRSDESAAWRWALPMAVILGFMATLGSGTSSLFFGAGMVAWIYVFLLGRRLPPLVPRERIVGGVLLSYFAYSLLVGAAYAGWATAYDASYNNIGFVLALALLPILPLYQRDYWEDWVRYGLIAGGVVMICAALFMTLRGVRQVELLAGNPLVFAYVGGALTLVNGALALSSAGRWRSLHAVAALSGIPAIFLSGSRGPILYFVVVALAGTVGWVLRQSRRRIRDAAIVVGSILVVSAISYPLLNSTRSFQTTEARFGRLLESIREPADGVDASVDSRLAMLKAGWAAFEARPLTGYGRSGVIDAANAQFDDDPEFDYSHLHNAYLNEAVSGGIIALLLYIATLLTPILAARHADVGWRLAAALFTAFTAANALTNIGFYHDITVAYFCAWVVAFNFLSSKAERSRPSGAEGNSG